MSDGDGTTLEDAAWARVAADYFDPEPHRAFVALSVRTGRLAEAARRYRQAREALGADDVALRSLLDERLAAIALLAVAELDAQRTPQPPMRSSRWLVLMATFMALASGAMLLWALW
jgi:hypothetical protein